MSLLWWVYNVNAVISWSNVSEFDRIYYYYSKTSGTLWQYCREEQDLDDDNTIIDFSVANSIADAFKIKAKVTGQTGVNGTKNVQIMVPLKYLSNFWRTEMSLNDCEINIDLNWSKTALQLLLI